MRPSNDAATSRSSLTEMGRQLYEQLRLSPAVRPLLERRYERFFAIATDALLFRGVYASYSEAFASAPATKSIGYDNPEPAAMFRTDLERVRPSDYPVLFWLGRAIDDGVRHVLDYGGHVALKYFAFQDYLTYPESLRWTVCDVPAVVRAGRELARERGASAVSFVTEFERAAEADLLLTSGALQFIEPSLPELLAQLPQRPRHVIVNSTSFTERPTFYTLHSTGSVFCPYKLENLPAFVAGMERLGYELLDQWENPAKSCVIPFRPEHSVRGYTGLYLRA